MKATLHHNRETGVAYVDVAVNIPQDMRINMVDVTEVLGFKTQVFARVSEDGQLLGLVIEDYSAFSREVRRKYLAFAVERIIDLILSKVREFTSGHGTPSHRLPAHA